MKNFLLILLAIILLIPFGALGFIFACIRQRPLGPYFGRIAQSLNQFGNAVCGPIFNQWMITSDGYPFGNIDEGSSSVLGKNKRLGTLTPSGKWLDRLLNLIDEDHSIDSIEENP